MNEQFNKIDLNRWLKMFEKKNSVKNEGMNRWLGWINKGLRNEWMGK